MTYVRDRWISAQLETELLLDMAVLHINYDIETVNGVVYLIGIVQEEGELARVVGHASAIPGVRHVADHVIAQRSRAPSACTSRPPAHGMNVLWGCTSIRRGNDHLSVAARNPNYLKGAHRMQELTSGITVISQLGPAAAGRPSDFFAAVSGSLEFP